MNLLLAYLGGLLLNLMPCILPTLALKAMSKDRDWFAAGMLTVFAALGGLAAILGLGWGQHMQSQPFIVGLTAVTFICGLAYLGAWEVPALGFRHRSSAFSQGVLATLVGTGCSGPFLAPVFASTLTQSPWSTFAIFMSVGLGMTTPYLLPIPLPKPGAWMDTVKRVAGFGMIATALWLLTGVSNAWLFPTLILLLLLAFACCFPRVWWVAILAIAPFFMEPSATKWQDYDPAVLQSGQVVLVQFSAPLCLTCDMNKAILNTLDLTGVTPVYADVANNPAAAELLTKLGYDSVPVLAIFAPGREPVVMPDLITATAVVAALQNLGVSQ